MVRRNRGRTYTLLPLMPFEEAWHRTFRRGVTNDLAGLEDREVARLLGELGGPRRADVVTIVPTYERPVLLAEAVASALAQPVADHLVVVVHDGRAASSLPAHPRLLEVELSAHTGVVGVVRNVALRVTEGRLVAFLDDDNTWLPEHLPLALAAHADADVRFTYSDVGWWGPDGRDLGVLARPYSRRKLAHENYIDINSAVVARSLDPELSRMPRRRGEFAAEDWELVWRLSKRTTPVHLPHVTVRYLCNPDSYYSDHRVTLRT